GRGDFRGPLVVGGSGDLEQPARHGDVAVLLSLLRLDERVAVHRVSLAKKTVARFKMSRSSRSTLVSLRSATSSACSSVVSPGRRPASISTWAIQRRNAVSLSSRSRAIWAIDLPLVRQSSTTSALSSSENDLRVRLPFPIVSMMDILSGRCRPIVDVRQSGSSPVALGGARTGRADTPFSRLWSGSYQVTPDRSRAPDGRHIRRKPQHQPDRSRTSQPTRRLPQRKRKGEGVARVRVFAFVAAQKADF